MKLEICFVKQITCHRFHLTTVNKIIPEVHLYGLREEIPLGTWEERTQQQTKRSWEIREITKVWPAPFKDQKTKLSRFRTIFCLFTIGTTRTKVILCSCEIAIDLEA